MFWLGISIFTIMCYTGVVVPNSKVTHKYTFYFFYNCTCSLLLNYIYHQGCHIVLHFCLVFDVHARTWSHVFKKSLSEGKLPADWKVANIIPIYKKGNKSSPRNYRPASLISVVCKVFESIIRERMLDHLFSNAGLDVIMSAWVPTSEALHGFLPRKSCMTQLLHALNDWTESLDRGNSIDVLYLESVNLAWDMHSR